MNMIEKGSNFSLKLYSTLIHKRHFFLLIGALLIIHLLYRRRRWVLAALDESNILNILFLVGMSLIVHVLYSRGRWLLAKIGIFLGLIWIVIIFPVIDILKGIGVDSFAEAKSFDISEALFFFDRLSESVVSELTLKKIEHYFVLIAIGAILFFVLRWLRIKRGYDPRKWAFVKLAAGSVFSFSAIAFGLYGSINGFLNNSSHFTSTRKNFSGNAVSLSAGDRNKLTVVAYIGESTSSLNMGIYGYPRDTTPELHKLINNDHGALLFNNVFSTHTHTTPSLLEALSIGANGRDDLVPINERKRISAVDIFTAAGLKTYLLSNQGQAGTSNQVSTIIFRNAYCVFSSKNRYWGSADLRLPKPNDHVFFGRHIISKLDTLKQSSGGVLFLHSYAGHGAYLKNIPEDFRKPVDGSLSVMNSAAVFGPLGIALYNVDAYDSAVRYVDYSVAQVIQTVKARTEPIVFFYFSDHGESIYTNRIHDSSRFTHEMARIPFLIYFNQAARYQFRDLFEEYRARSKSGSISTLAQLPSTLFDILGLKVASGIASQRPVIGSSNDLPVEPIVVRRVANSVTYVNLNKPTDAVNPASPSLLDTTDNATSIFALAKSNPFKTTKLCYHRSNTLGKALRGSLIADCLELDVMVDPDGSLSVYHPPLDSVDLKLGQIVDIARRKRLSLWLDAKNLNEAKNCNVLAEYLSGAKTDGQVTLVEFPSSSRLADKHLLSCTSRLRAMGLRTSFYVPTGLAISCSSGLRAGASVAETYDCQRLQYDLNAAYQSTLFTDFSFDYRGILAMETIGVAQKLRWNTWGITPKLFASIKPERFGLVILSNNDPNNR